MLAFHALVALVVPSFIWLGFWQWGRGEDKAAAAALQEANIAADPVPVQELTAPGEDVPPEDRWRQVTATGTYDTEHELLVRNRDGSRGVGLHVLTPLVTDDGPALLVNRGWIEQPPSATARPEVPPAPEGEVTVTGRLQFSETPENTGIRVRDGLPEGQIMIVDVDRIAEGLPYPVYGGYAELTEQSPEGADAPEPVAAPEVDTGMNLSYAVQWWVFTVIAIVGWIILMRREVKDARDASAGPPDTPGSGGGGPGAGPDGTDGTDAPGGGPDGEAAVEDADAGAAADAAQSAAPSDAADAAANPDPADTPGARPHSGARR
ncbi:SURF1 family protein [Streptomonospora sp. S1-112]|uniref:SURF1-like protein n=2 Tax=Streptomonospora mangrovi TaxID=2883123 RepID=A0A9X3NPL6_9ACTN|nr:SURF1 family protein [Streptomonospora mangrovi]MDA0565921.1 SURF1 family protein [Streptomonospora mangrovi]